MTKLGLHTKKQIEATERRIADQLQFIYHQLKHHYIDPDDAWTKVQDLDDSDAWFEDVDKAMQDNQIQYTDNSNGLEYRTPSDAKVPTGQAIKNAINDLSSKLLISRLNDIDLDAEHRIGSPKHLYQDAIQFISDLTNPDSQDDILDELSTYLINKNGKIYHRADLDDQWTLADDSDLCDDLDEVLEFAKDLL